MVGERTSLEESETDRGIWVSNRRAFLAGLTSIGLAGWTGIA
jgi:hypothetical protein